jgi:hypothetical protein
VRWAALGAGVVLVVAAFLAGSRVADTREGLIYEVVTLLAGLAGVSLLLYGLVAPMSRAGGTPQSPRVAPPTSQRVHNAGELLVGVAGLVISAVLLGGIAATAGWLWALLGGVLLLPMIAGCIYLSLSFARAERREWTIDFQKLMRNR